MSDHYEILDLDPDSKYNRNQAICTRTRFIIGICIIALIIIAFIIFLSIILSQRKCVITNEGISGENIYNLNFPLSPNPKYTVNFNITTMQANYVYYISTSGGNRCKGCKYFRADPYGIDILKDVDYTNTGFDRGHLVPNADYGYDTFYINNVVPMQSDFNRGTWAESEQYIRDNYSGYYIYKGCDYTEEFQMTETGKKLYIPRGCYYVILGENHKLIEYGYYLNQKDSLKEDKLPFWAQCK